MFETLLDPIFTPLLKMNSLLAIILVSALVSFIVTLAYKLATDQNMMKQLKSEMKDYQKQMRSPELRKEPDKLMQMQKKAMEVNAKYMKHSFKSTLFTIIPIIIIFSWMSAHFAFFPIVPGAEFTLTAHFSPGAKGNATLELPEGISTPQPEQEIEDNAASWSLSGDKGEYLATVVYGDKGYDKEILIDEYLYKAPSKTFKNEAVTSITLSNKERKIFNLLGWKLGWLGTYIIFSIIFSIVIRKIMKVY